MYVRFRWLHKSTRLKRQHSRVTISGAITSVILLLISFVVSSSHRSSKASKYMLGKKGKKRERVRSGNSMHRRNALLGSPSCSLAALAALAALRSLPSTTLHCSSPMAQALVASRPLAFAPLVPPPPMLRQTTQHTHTPDTPARSSRDTKRDCRCSLAAAWWGRAEPDQWEDA